MKKILIIEDDPIVAHIYKTRLEKEGYELQVASDGQSGFYSIHEFQPDAMLLDLMLPKMNGLDILKKIRAEAKFNKIPVVVFTNAYVPNMINEAFQAGATQVFNKATLTPRQIIDALNNIILSYANPGGAPPSQAASRSSPTAGGEPASPATPNNLGEAAFHDRPRSGTGAGAQAGQNAITAISPASEETQAQDTVFQADLLKSFLEAIPEAISGLRKTTQDFSKAQDEATRLPQLLELYRKVHAITGSAGMVGFRHISKMAAAMEVLLKELYEKPKNVTASSMRTVAHSIDFLAELCSQASEDDVVEDTPSHILIVDDEILSRRAITYALEKAGLKSTSVEESQVALKLATEYTFDLIFLDVQMPGMDGFDLCSRIRSLPANKTTPVIFVTSLTDFKSRAKSSLSGGADLIAKPFMFIELSVKALVHVLRAQVSKKAKAPAKLRRAA